MKKPDGNKFPVPKPSYWSRILSWLSRHPEVVIGAILGVISGTILLSFARQAAENAVIWIAQWSIQMLRGISRELGWN